MPVRLYITETTESIKAKIIGEIRFEVNKRMRAASPIIRQKVGNLIADRLMDTEHAQSIMSGKLQSDFGLTPDAALTALGDLIRAIRQSTGVNLDVKNGFAYSLSVTILPNGLSQTLQGIGTYSSNGHIISWMQWLLLKGVTVVVDDHFVVERNSSKSRSGRALMYKSGSSGRNFRVDPHFAGTEDDNFVVNTIKGLFDEVYFIVMGYL